MPNPNDVTIQACPFGGNTCRNGKRDDFEVNPLTQERFVCAKWVCLKGKDPQSEKILDNWMCSEQAAVFLLLENAQMTRHVQASVDKAANEVNAGNAMVFAAMSPEAQQRVVNAQPRLVERGPAPQLEEGKNGGT